MERSDRGQPPSQDAGSNSGSGSPAALGQLGVLRRYPGIRWLWLAEGVSTTGTQVTYLALPTFAALVLEASPLAIAALFAMEYVPLAVLGPVLGVMADRFGPKRVMLLSDVARGLTLATVVATGIGGALGLPHLLVAAFVVGLFTQLYGIASQALVAQVAEREHLADANATLETVRSTALVAGPGLGGVVVQLVGAVRALTVDIASYLFSIFCLLRIKVARPPTTSDETAASVLKSLAEGFQLFRRRPALVRTGVASAALNLGGGVIGGIYVLLVYDVLESSPAVLGLAHTSAYVGTLLGAVASAHVLRRLGLQTAIKATCAVSGLAFLLLYVSGSTGLLLLLFVYNVTFGVASTIFGLGMVYLRQITVPVESLGRVTSWMRTMAVVTLPVGALGGGFVAEHLGVLTTVLIGALLAALAPLCLVGLRIADSDSAETRT